ncbi:MAG: DUF11 domain-containing protein [Bacteroidota bacterium]
MNKIYTAIRGRQLIRHTYWYPLILTLSILLLPNMGLAEGTKQLAPTDSDLVMLMIGRADFGSFASFDGPESSRLYITINNPNEIVYLGLGRALNNNGELDNSSTPSYQFQIKRAIDGAIVHGPFNINTLNSNTTSWEDAVLGPRAITGEGYETNHSRFIFEPTEAGDYYIEFRDIQYLGNWDITVAMDDTPIPGRIWSRNWAFRTPPSQNIQPECIWEREFNGQLYSYTKDGFVTKIDFSNSGFQGLSFNVAFNETGPGTSGDFALDRQSVLNANLTDNVAQHRIFLQEPDIVVFPDGLCGGVTAVGDLQCSVEGSGLCLPLTVERAGTIEILLDFNGNGQFDPGGQDVLLVQNFEEGDLEKCIPWDGLKADGTSIGFTEQVDLVLQYAQGAQHWAVYDGEFLKNGFCIETIRPICANSVNADRLYWDDRNIQMEPGTGQLLDGRAGCSCEDDCRTWTNFNTNVDDCLQTQDVLTTGYGDKNTLNTWWFANIVLSARVNVPIFSVGLSGPDLFCENTPSTIELITSGDEILTSVVWSGPNGAIDAGSPNATSILVSEEGTYTAVVQDQEGCDASASITLESGACDVDIELSKTSIITEAYPGEVIPFVISVTNTGTDPATGVVVRDSLPGGFSQIGGISNGGILEATGPTSSQRTITWPPLDLAPGQTQLFTYSAVLSIQTSTLPEPYYLTNLAEVIAINEEDNDSTPNNGVDTNGNGIVDNDSSDEDDGDAHSINLLPCNILASISDLTCLDNGTPSDASDDQFTFNLLVERDGPGTSWTANDGTTSTYGTTVSMGPYAIIDGAINLQIADALPEYCSTSITIEPPPTCSNLCVIEASLVNVNCLDNDTPSDPSDDVFTFEVMVTGLNTADTWTSTLGQSGNYEESVILGPLPINDEVLTVTLTDESDNACTTTLEVSPPETCSKLCAIEATVVEVVCDANGTPSDDSDDLFTIDIIVDGLNTGNGYSINIGNDGIYGELTTVGPFAIAAGGIVLTVTDELSSECVASVEVSPPAACSDACAIQATVQQVLCDDNNTPSLADDDVFTFQLVVEGSNTGLNWITDSGATGNYGTPTTFDPFDIAAGAVNLTITDGDDSNCQTTVEVVPPNTCSDLCAIEASLLDVFCDDNGTSTEPEDDLFFADVIIAGQNVGDSWIASNGNTGAYNEATRIGPFSIAQGAVALSFTDIDDMTCEATLTLAPPMTCSDECLIEVQSSLLVCGDNGTPEDIRDDAYIMEVLVNGAGIGTTWTTGDGRTWAYGEMVEIDQLSIVNGFFELSITDTDDPMCSTMVQMETPSFEVICPEDTSSVRIDRAANIIAAALDDNDPIRMETDTFCWIDSIPLPTGLRYFDTIHIRTSNLLPPNTPYTFALYSSMEVSNPPPFYPVPFVDGLGAIFRDHINPLDPCCTIMRGDTSLEAAMLRQPLPRLDADLEVEGTIVWMTSLPLQPNEHYVLLTSTWLPETTGSYTWVVFSESEDIPYLIVEPEEVALAIEDSINLEYDLLCEDYTQLLDTTYLTGMATVADSCGLNNFFFTDAWIAEDCTSGVIERTFIAENNNGMIDNCVQMIDFKSAEFDDIDFPAWYYVLNCFEDFEVDMDGNPHPNVTGYPFVKTAFGAALLDSAFCNLSAVYEDSLLQVCGLEREVERTWLVLDQCLPEDTLEMVQIIKVKGERPRIECPISNHYCPIVEDDIMLWSVDPFSTTATVEIPLPDVYGGCQEGWDVLTQVYRNNADGTLTLVYTIQPDEERFLFDVAIGDYTVRYSLLGGCEFAAAQDCIIRVADLVEPVAICYSPIQIAIGNLGVRYVNVQQINNNSYDNTEIASIEISREYTYDIDGCEPLAEPTFSDWGQFVVMECCDVGTTVKVMLRVTDIYGNENFCWSEVRVVDTTLPICFGIPNAETECSELPDSFDPFDTALLQSIWGLPEAYDNCTPEVIELAPQVNFDQCSSGTIIRSFYAEDTYGNVSLETVTQVITITGERNYEIRFPKDGQMSCGEQMLSDSIFTNEIGCELLAATFEDELLPDGEGCYQLERTHYVINWCEYDGEADPVVISRDEDCDGQEGEEAVWVLRRTTTSFIDRDSVSQNAVPFATEKGISCTGTTNPQGYWRTVESNGYWQYTQIISVIDTIAPEIMLSGDTNLCIDSLGCEAAVSFSLALSQGCVLDSIADLSIEFDAFADGEADDFPAGTGEVLTGTFPNYQVNFNYTSGTHLLLVRAVDLCGNVATQTLEFVIENCSPITQDCDGGLYNYEIRFPADKQVTCFDESVVPDIDLFQLGCGDLEVQVRDAILPSTGLICMRVARTYLVKNDCAYDGISEPVVIGRDEDCNEISGEADVWVLRKAHLTRVDIDRDPFNNTPLANTRGTSCNGNSNPAGYWRNIDSKGYWSYTQIITVVDETPPSLNLTMQADTLCADATTCDAFFETSFTIEDGCPMEGSARISVWLDLDTDGILDLDLMEEGAVSGDFPDFTIADDFPIGEHEIIITAVDGCGNDIMQSIQLVVLDCTIEPIECHEDLVFTVEQVNPPQDVNGDGTIDRGMVEIVVEDILAEQIADCSVVTYSINLAGEMPDINQQSIILTCDGGTSRGIEVYAWDDAFNPMQIMPDGTMGGRNFTGCSTTVILAAPNGVCKPAKGDEEVGIPLDQEPTLGEDVGVGPITVPGSPDDIVKSETVKLFHNMPNPFNEQTTISFYLSTEKHVSLYIHTATGERLWQLQGRYDAGEHRVIVYSKDLPKTGILFYSLQTGTFFETKKMLVLDK